MTNGSPNNGDLEREAAALRAGCAVWDESTTDVVEMLGDDRHRFLNGLVTAEVLKQAAGSSTYGLFTSIKGRVLADVTAIVLDDRIWLRLPAGRGESIREHAAQYVITDRVELRLVDGLSRVAVGGPAAEENLAAWVVDASGEAGLPAEPGDHRRLSVRGIEARVLRELRDRPERFSLWVPTSDAIDLMVALLDSREAPKQIGSAAVEAVRIELGVPRYGVDFGEETFPQEADLDSAVSYEKGCYLGQEVVARIHFRGGVNRILRGLEVEGGSRVSPGDVISSEGKEVGRVTSANATGRALGLLALSAAEPGGRVEIDRGLSARVLALQPSGKSEQEGTK